MTDGVDRFFVSTTAHQYLGVHTCIIFNKYYGTGSTNNDKTECPS